MISSNSINNIIRSISTPLSQATRTVSVPHDDWDKNLEKLEKKFLGNPGRSLTSPAQVHHAWQTMTAYANRPTSGSLNFTRGMYHGLTGMYEKLTGQLLAYERMKVNDVAASVSWAFENGLLPDKANDIIDIGAANGGATVQFGKKYQEAKILALDPDPQSAKFIEEKIKSSTSVLIHPERVDTYTGTLQKALSERKIQENNADLIVMQAVAPYMSDMELENTLQGIHVALAPGGKVVLSSYGEEHFSKAAGAENNVVLRSDMQLLDMFENTGFSVECIGNTLQSGDGRTYQKNSREMSDVMKQKSLPEHPDGQYWHSVYIAATKI